MRQFNGHKSAAAAVILGALVLAFQNCGGPPENCPKGEECKNDSSSTTPNSNPLPASASRRPPLVGVGGSTPTGSNPNNLSNSNRPFNTVNSSGPGGPIVSGDLDFEIIENPSSQNVVEGATVVMRVRVAGSGGALYYQWFHNGTALGEPSTLYSSLSFEADGTWKRGNYYVKIWEDLDSAPLVSDSAELDIEPKIVDCPATSYLVAASTDSFHNHFVLESYLENAELRPIVLARDYFPKYFIDHEYRYLVSTAKILEGVGTKYGTIFTDQVRSKVGVQVLKGLKKITKHGSQLRLNCQTGISGINAKKSELATGEILFACEGARYKFIKNSCKEP